MLYSYNEENRMSLSKNDRMMNMKSFLICTFLVSITLSSYGSSSNVIEAQETKGGSSSKVSSASISSSGIKGAAGFSSFRQKIASIQNRQQQQQLRQQQRFEKQEEQVIQQIQQPIQPSTVQISNIVSSTSTLQRPILTSQQVTSTIDRVVEEQRENGVQQVTQTDAEPAVYGSVNGVPGIDFPGYTSIPNTPFSCEGRPYDPGMYADEFTGCQVYHLCYQGRRESFFCGIGTVFNQAILNCDFWHSVDCSKSSKYYYLNAELGKASAEGGQINSNSIKQELSSRFLSNQIQVQPTPILKGKTSFVREQQLSTNQLVVPRPKFASSSFSRIETSSQSAVPQVLNGKTSFRREEQSFRNSQNPLSPARQFQLNQRESFSNSNVDQNYIEANQQTLESSNQIKVVSGNKQQNSGKTSTIFDNKRKSNPFSRSEGDANEISKSEDENSVWKPYFKSRPTSNNPIPTPTQSSPKPTTDMATSEFAASTVSLPDKEPSFSNLPSSNTNKVDPSNEQPKVPKSSAPSETSTTKADEKDANSNVSIEPDVSPALTVTPSAPEAPTTEMSYSSGSTTAPTPTPTSAAPVEATTLKASLDEATTDGNSEDDNGFESRSSRSSGSGNARDNSSSRFLTSRSGVEYENEPSERNKTQSGMSKISQV